MRNAGVLGLVAIFIVSAASSAFAQVSDDAASRPLRGQRDARADWLAEREADMFMRLDIEKRFGMHVRRHIPVCSEVVEGEAHCDADVITNEKGTPLASPKVIFGYGPAQLLKAYNLTGQAAGNPIIAIVDAYDDPNIAADLATYSATFGIPQLPTCSGAIANSSVPCFKKVNQQGSTSRYPRSDAGWSLEIALDVEVAHAVCQNCRILLVEANSPSYANLMTAVDTAVALGANVVSNSYGATEFSGETSYDSHFNRPGVAFTVSSGDSGYGLEYPAASRYVTAVGGTSLFLNPDGSYNSEIAWSGSGSGCSKYEAKQPWQLDTGCARRTVADVSADADPNTGAAVYDSVRYFGQSGWFQVGGTSLASPIIAAVYALSGNIPAGKIESSVMYASAASNLHDILSGSNGSCSTLYLCTAQSGFDGPTGLGSPNGVGAF